MTKNGKQKLKYRGVLQNSCVWVWKAVCIQRFPKDEVSKEVYRSYTGYYVLSPKRQSTLLRTSAYGIYIFWCSLQLHPFLSRWTLKSCIPLVYMTGGMRGVRTTGMSINFKMPLVYWPVVLHNYYLQTADIWKILRGSRCRLYQSISFALNNRRSWPIHL